MIKITNISKLYNNVSILNNISFTINKGEIVGLLGKNGAGKTTLLSILSQEILPTSGSIFIDNIPIQKANNSKICIVQQELGLFDFLSVKDHLKYFAVIRNNDTAPTKKRIEEVITDLKLEKILSKNTIQLSGGEKRRVMIALALLSNPDILILDEPTANLDVEWRLYLMDYLLYLNQEKRKTVIYSSHILDEVEKICSKIFILNKGQKAFYGSVENFKSSFTFNQKLIIKNNNNIGFDNILRDVKLQINNSDTLVLKNQGYYTIYFQSNNYNQIITDLLLTTVEHTLESLSFEDFFIINGQD